MPRSFPDGSRPAFPPDDLFGERYALGELIGEGGMGRVFRAEQRASCQSVAVKFLRPSLAGDADMLRRFHTEVRAASLLSHPNLVAVIDYGVAVPGGPFLVMEYVHGTSLTDLLYNDGPLAPRRAAGLLDQILAALEAAHGAGVIHADIKSDNILVESSSRGDGVKIIDFGLARLRRRADVASSREELLCGTPEYLAPEVIGGRAPAAASDLYAAGIILFELLTGTTPFAGGTSRQVLKRQLTESVMPPSLRRPDRPIPAALEQVVLQALAKDPTARFADATSFRGALAEAIDRMTDDMLPAGRLGVAGRHEQDERLRLQYAAIALALQRGALDEIAEGYLELARTLVGAGQLAVAIRELEEGIDVV
ncbi:MAG TPA: serine/threonine-protein kinase, partial [Kofleriaceae bacterium]